MTEQDKFISYIEEFHDKGWKIVEKKIGLFLVPVIMLLVANL